MTTRDVATSPPSEAPQWMKDFGTFLAVLIVPGLVFGVLILVAFLGVLVFLPFVPPLLAEFMGESAAGAAASKKPSRPKHRVFVPLGKLRGHGLTHA